MRIITLIIGIFFIAFDSYSQKDFECVVKDYTIVTFDHWYGECPRTFTVCVENDTIYADFKNFDCFAESITRKYRYGYFSFVQTLFYKIFGIDKDSYQTGNCATLYDENCITKSSLVLDSGEVVHYDYYNCFGLYMDVSSKFYFPYNSNGFYDSIEDSAKIKRVIMPGMSVSVEKADTLVIIPPRKAIKYD